MNESNPKLKPTEVSTRTFRLDLLRGMFRGVLTSGTQTFGLFIAIRYFQADDTSNPVASMPPGRLANLTNLFRYGITGKVIP